MCRRITHGFLPGLAAVTLFAWGCDRPGTPASPKPSFWERGGPEACPAGERFTGGGRVDPPVGKTTFGFNVDARNWCRTGSGIRGQLQTVYHPTHTRVHSLTIDDFHSFRDPERGGRCAEWAGTARVKDGNGSWREETFDVVACDNGEPGSSPGSGPDRYGITLGDGRSIGIPDLTGGNIQAH